MCLVGAALLAGSCAGTTAPTSGGVSSIDSGEVIGNMAVAFLNRFAASTISPADCLVDFADVPAACRIGKQAELDDITANREHYVILGARLGPATVDIETNGVAAQIRVPCAFDSRIIECPQPGCTLTSTEHVDGSCALTAVKDANRWWLCNSAFNGGVSSVTPPLASPRALAMTP